MSLAPLGKCYDCGYHICKCESMKKSKITKRVKKNNSKGKIPRRLKPKQTENYTTDSELEGYGGWPYPW